MLNLYFTLVFPYLSYCDSVWGNINKSTLQSLQRAQNRALKTDFRLPCLYPSTDLYADTGLDTLDTIIAKNNLQFAFTGFHGLLSEVSSTFSGRHHQVDILYRYVIFLESYLLQSVHPQLLRNPQFTVLFHHGIQCHPIYFFILHCGLFIDIFPLM